MLTSITLGGFLGERFGREWNLDLDLPSPAEAVRALSAVCKGFRAFVLEHELPGYHVIIGEREDVAAEDLRKPTGRQTITIMPVLAGAKSDWVNIIIGGVLIAGGVAITIATAGAGVGAGISLLHAGGLLLGSYGVAMAVGGISRLLAGAPPPAATQKETNDPNYVFAGPVNTTGVGQAVPILYGQLEVGSQVVSAGLATRTATTYTAPTGSGGEPTTDADGDPPIGKWWLSDSIGND